MAVVKRWLVNGMGLSIEKNERPGGFWFCGYVKAYVADKGLGVYTAEHLKIPKAIKALKCAAGEMSYFDCDGFRVEVGFDTAHVKNVPETEGYIEFLTDTTEDLARQIAAILEKGDISFPQEEFLTNEELGILRALENPFEGEYPSIIWARENLAKGKRVFRVCMMDGATTMKDTFIYIATQADDQFVVDIYGDRGIESLRNVFPHFDMQAVYSFPMLDRMPELIGKQLTIYKDVYYSCGMRCKKEVF